MKTWAWLGAWCAVGLIGCGGRTSMLGDEDPSINSSLPGDGSSGGAPSTAGAKPTPSPPATSAAGSGGASSSGGSPVPVAGAGTSTPPGPPMSFPGTAGSAAAGASGSFPSTGGSAAGGASSSGDYQAALNSCLKFCSLLAVSPCSAGQGSLEDCTLNCASELSQNPVCLPAGQAVIQCYTPIYGGAATVGVVSCKDLSTVAEQRCSTELNAFLDCSNSGPVVLPAPPPVPAPPPNSGPPQCSSGGGVSNTSVSNTTCTLSEKCSNGDYYSAQCTAATPDQAVCSCSSSNGVSATFNLNESLIFACHDAASVCGASIYPPGPPK